MNHIVALVGMCGSGKSVCCEEFTKAGWETVYFGGVTMNELEKRGLEKNEANERSVREELRSAYGPAAFAILLEPVIEEKLKKNNVCLDGLYSWSELLILREKFEDRLTVVAIVADRMARYERISRRPMRALSPEMAQKRDIAEIENMEKGGPIAMADRFILNDGNIEALKKKIASIIKEYTAD